jgi:hypothetical protein
MRARFHELGATIAAVEAVSGPLRAQRDDIVRQAQALADTTKPLELQILDAEARLYDAKNELAMLSRALGGNTAVVD